MSTPMSIHANAHEYTWVLARTNAMSLNGLVLCTSRRVRHELGALSLNLSARCSGPHSASAPFRTFLYHMLNLYSRSTALSVHTSGASRWRSASLRQLDPRRPLRSACAAQRPCNIRWSQACSLPVKGSLSKRAIRTLRLSRSTSMSISLPQKLTSGERTMLSVTGQQ